jgi:hypothetical protein
MEYVDVLVLGLLPCTRWLHQRERERETETETETEREGGRESVCGYYHVRTGLIRERKRKRERDSEREKEKENVCVCV